ncbi:acetyl-CoA carboxylase biotin carboxyl carrier protein [Solwaraspora sp. WMMB335]|uniref:acetyl-CoA carboxylase biotin carboxyl carrier protein n=1 Tax=Solwaraspora sp. WMMB335 TaxID=3404118 RepID=UPI003B9454D2
MTATSANGTPADAGGVPADASGISANPELAGQLRRLAEQTRALVGELSGPLRRVQVRHGDTVIEIEWHDRTAAAGPPPAVEPAAVDGQTRPPCLHQVASPIVGTFYRAAEPGGKPFVAVGDLIEPGQVVGIVEAMKLMNEITADRRGVVTEVHVGDGEPVEFDQPLVTLGPA